MYITDCYLENCGPISRFQYKFPLTPGGNPKPVILVGSNGSGKTVLLSYIVDALFELAITAFTDIMPGQSSDRHKYFKLTGVSNQKVGAAYSVGLLKFEHDNKRLYYGEKTGTLEPDGLPISVSAEYKEILLWGKADDHFKQAIGDVKAIEAGFMGGSICFFPSHRMEIPHWISLSTYDRKPVVSGSSNASMPQSRC